MTGDMNKHVLAAAGVLLLFYLLDGEVVGQNGYIFEVIHSMNSLGMSGFIMPVLCSLPGVLEYYEERETLNYRYKVIREGRMKYTAGTIVRGMLRGSLVVALALAALLVAFFVISSVEGNGIDFYDESGIYGLEDDRTLYVELFDAGKGWLVMLLNFAMMILHGAVWPCFGIAASCVIKNRKFAIAFPFLMYRLFAYIYDINEYITPLSFNMTLGIVYEPYGGFLRVIIYILAVFVICFVMLNGNMYYIYKRGD